MVISTIAELAGAAGKTLNTPVWGSVETTVRKTKNKVITTVDSRSLRLWEIAAISTVGLAAFFIPQYLKILDPAAAVQTVSEALGSLNPGTRFAIDVGTGLFPADNQDLPPPGSAEDIAIRTRFESIFGALSP